MVLPSSAPRPDETVNVPTESRMPSKAPQKAKAAKVRPLKITDTTLRDGHQCTIATRMRTDDLEKLAGDLDQVGFHSLEVWGGATFDTATRFLADDPWDRVRRLKKLAPKTPFQMLLRGQNVVGYRNYADDVVRAFVYHSAEVGIDIFRIFDALNDDRNLETSITSVKECGKHAQACVCFSVTEGKLGGPIYTTEYFVTKAKRLADMGADSICIKDMAGMISPQDACALVKGIKAEVDLPVQLHTHYTSGMASMAVLKVAEAGIDVVDCCLAPLGLRAAQPAVEPIIVALRDTDRDTGLDLKKLLEIGQKLEAILPKYRDYLDNTKWAAIDVNVLVHQVPGGMISNLIAQLREADALDRLPEVYEELPRTRADLGYPPLVTPTSQIVGVQAVNNVLFGRYKMVTDQVKDLCYGLYGRTPAPVNPEVIKLALKDYPRGQTPIRDRPGDHLAPEMEKAKEKTKGLAKDIGDVLTYALYPTTGERFLKWKYGLTPVPDEVKGKTLEDIKREDELIAKAKRGELIEKPPATEKGPNTRTFNVYVDGQRFTVDVDPGEGFAVPMRAGARPAVAPKPKATAPAAKPATAPATTSAAPAGGVALAAGEVAIKAPMPGMVIRYAVAQGQEVKAGDTVVVLEAMKMENALPAPKAGVVKSLGPAAGAKVMRDTVLAVIG